MKIIQMHVKHKQPALRKLSWCFLIMLFITALGQFSCGAKVASGEGNAGFTEPPDDVKPSLNETPGETPGKFQNEVPDKSCDSKHLFIDEDKIAREQRLYNSFYNYLSETYDFSYGDIMLECYFDVNFKEALVYANKAKDESGKCIFDYFAQMILYLKAALDVNPEKLIKSVEKEKIFDPYIAYPLFLNVVYGYTFINAPDIAPFIIDKEYITCCPGNWCWTESIFLSSNGTFSRKY